MSSSVLKLKRVPTRLMVRAMPKARAISLPLNQRLMMALCTAIRDSEQSAIISRWFKGKEMALAFGIALTISRVGTLFSFNTEELIARYFGSYRVALWAAAGFCLFSVLCNLVYNAMDLHGEKVLALPKPEGGDKIVLSDIRKFNSSYWYVVFLCVTFYSAIFPFTALATDMFHDKWGIPLV